jgi:hypothetical protein
VEVPHHIVAGMLAILAFTGDSIHHINDEANTNTIRSINTARTKSDRFALTIWIRTLADPDL